VEEEQAKVEQGRGHALAVELDVAVVELVPVEVVDAVPDGVGETDGSRSYRYIVSRYDDASLLQPTIGSSISSAVVRFQATSDSF
jgi:hypothetical protein